MSDSSDKLLFAHLVPPTVPPVFTPPTLIILYGYPGCGKLTTANLLAPMLPSFKIFHNHLVIDVLTKLFAFGTESFRKYREQIWLDLMCEAGRNGDSLIFTYCPEWTMSNDFLSRLQKGYEAAGAEAMKKFFPAQDDVTGKVVYIQLDCELATVRDRMTNESRKEFGKMFSVELFDMVYSSGAFNVPQPIPDFTIDVNNTPPEQNAAAIRDFLMTK